MLIEMEIDTGNHPPVASKPYTLPLKHYKWVQREIETLEVQRQNRGIPQVLKVMHRETTRELSRMG